MASNDPISVTLTAKDGTNHIYISSDTSLNVLTLTLTNTTTTDIIFQQYTSSGCSIGSLPANNSGVYLLFNGLLPSSVISGISYNAMGWNLYLNSDERNGTYLVFTPTSNITLTANSSLSITIQLPAISGSANSGYFSCQYVNVLANSNNSSSGEQLYVSLVYPPHSAESSPAVLPIQFEFIDTNTVFRYSGSNKGAQSLNFRITNTSNAPLVTAGTVTDESPVPKFTLSFVQDNNSASGSLLTNSQASNVRVGTNQLYNNLLDVTPETNTIPATWTIASEESVAPSAITMLGTGVSASASFSITGIQTSVMADTITMAILEYSGFPGYEDGQITAEIVIRNAPPAQPVINSFYASTHSVNVKYLPYTITLTYNISNTSKLELYNGHNQLWSTTDFSQSTDVTVTATITAASVFTLKAYNSANEFVTSTILVNVDTVPIRTIMMWSGNSSTIPAGWQICDGTNGTPNLSQKFILGALGDSKPNNSANNYYLNQTGGGENHHHSVTTPSQNLTTTGNGSHVHSITLDSRNNLNENSNSGNHHYYFGSQGVSNDAIQTNSGNPDGSHSHSVSVASKTFDSGDTATPYPPYHALYFIMKIS